MKSLRRTQGTMSEQAPNTGDPRVSLAEQRTEIAKFRTQIALDRTTLAWIRTTVTMATFGFGTVGFFRSLEEKNPTARSVQLHYGAVRFGLALIILGIVATVASGLSHWFALRRLRRGDDPVLTQWPLSITLAMLVSVLGLVGLWFVVRD
jgi:uncharacterized membrane protein YidH (DUF202 family)